MARYSIEDTVLTDIADSLRNQTTGDTRIEYEITPNAIPLTKISKTVNATSFTTYEGTYGYDNSAVDRDTITIEGASRLQVVMGYQTHNTAYDYVQVYTGSSASGTKYGGTTMSKITLNFSGDTVNFYFKSNSSTNNYLGYYAEVTGYDADGNVIMTDLVVEKEVPNVFKPGEMAGAIENLKVGINTSYYNCLLLVNTIDKAEAVNLPQWQAWKTITAIANSPTTKTVSSAGANTAMGTTYVSSGFKGLNTIPSVDKIKAILFFNQYNHYIWFMGMPYTQLSETEIALEFPLLQYNGSYSNGYMYNNTSKFGLDLKKELVYQNVSSGTLAHEIVIIYED